MPTRSITTRRLAVLCATFLLASGSAACGSTSSDSPSATPATSTSPVAAGLSLEDGWVKAVDVPMGPGTSGMPSPTSTTSGTDNPAGMAPMSAMFGILRNTTDSDITITGGSSAAAGAVELHETVKNDAGELQMQPREGGFLIPAGGTHALEPGGDHIMLMALRSSLESGTTTTVTLTTSAGDLLLVVPVRSFAGAEESYVPTPSPS